VTESLSFTGERFTPECVREIWYEHWHRYALAARFAAGRRVLDAACGEGYGSALLARHAREVTGVDISEPAIAHARARYAAPNLRFERGDATALAALPDAAFDLIVSFETIEHVAAQEALVAGFARLLAPGGVLLLSSPDKRTYSEAQGFANEFHVRELYREELEALLAPHFPARLVLGQKLLFQSVAWPLERAASGVVADTLRADGTLVQHLDYAPLYFLVFCAREAAHLPDAGVVSLFGDAAESVYGHYNGEVRRNMQAGTLLADMERRLVAAEARAAAAERRAALPPTSLLARLRRWLFG
jgi:2-polyprenyl-3-methyl-5-hydroxy-6-metoxy-1,4-benzoquinol methylase